MNSGCEPMVNTPGLYIVSGQSPKYNPGRIHALRTGESNWGTWGSQSTQSIYKTYVIKYKGKYNWIIFLSISVYAYTQFIILLGGCF